MNAAAPSPAPARGTSRRSTAGIMLIECLVYLGVFAFITGLATLAMYRAWDAHRVLTLRADDVGRLLRAGELWRADVRGATGSLSNEVSEVEQALHIPRREGEVVWVFSEGQIWRGDVNNSASGILLPKVTRSRMAADRRQHVTAWRWEVEVPAPRGKLARPLVFSFAAMPPTKP